MSQKQIMKSLRHKIPAEQYVEMYGLGAAYKQGEAKAETEANRGRPREPAPEPPKTKLSAQAQKYRDLLMEIGGTSKAKLLTADDNVAAEVPVRELVEKLKSDGKGVKAIVFDGIITQRILDLAHELGMQSVIGTKKGTVNKVPSGIEVYTRDDFT